MSSKNQTFMEKYHSLSFLEKKILQILSISYASLTQTQLLACLVALEIKTEDGKSFDSGTKNDMLKRLRSPLDLLLSTNILHGKSRSALLINRDYIEVLTRHLVAEKRFTTLVDTLQHTLNLTPEGLSQEQSLSMGKLIRTKPALTKESWIAKDQFRRQYPFFDKLLTTVDVSKNQRQQLCTLLNAVLKDLPGVA